MTETELNARLDALEKQITRDEDIQEIRKCINTYLLYFQGADANGITATVDWDAPRVWSEAGMGGRSVGSRPNLEFFDQRPTLARMPGALVQHESASAVIEIAGDGQTAKVADYSPGFKCLAQALSQTWSQGKYYHDMIKVNGRWKIWHWHWFIIVEGSAAYGWLYQNRSYWKECLFPELDGIHNNNVTVPMEPGTYNDNYRVDGHVYLYPEPPYPYETWEGEDDMKNTRPY